MGLDQMGPKEKVRFAVGWLGLAWLGLAWLGLVLLGDILVLGPMCFTPLAVITCNHC